MAAGVGSPGLGAIITGTPGKYVKLEDTVKAFKMIVNGELDELPEQAFYMRGGIDEVIEAAEKMKAGV